MARETPWSTWDEWIFVKELLFFFDDSEKQLDGIKFVQTWKSRIRNGALPVSIELTATLVAANLEIYQTQQNEHQVKLAAAMALVRFVNGITDQLQTGVYAQSVQIVAEKIGIPDWMVDLRHEITHAQLPSLTIITSGIMFALNWLFQNYWEETLKKVNEQEQSMYKNFYDNLQKYESVIESVWPQCCKSEIVDLKKTKKVSQDFMMISQSTLKLLSQNNLHILSHVLTRNKLFVLNTEFLTELNLPIDSNSELDEDHISLLNVLASQWKPFMTCIQEKFKMFNHILIEFILIEPKNQVCVMYTLYMLSQIQPDLSIDIISYLCKNPSILSFHILERISKKFPFGKAGTTFLIDTISNFKTVATVLSKKNLLNCHSWKNLLENHGIGKEFIELIGKITESNSGQIPNVPSQNSKWRLLSKSETAALPPIGLLPKGCTFHDLHLKKRILKVLNISSMNYKLSDTEGKMKRQYFNENLEGVINGLFTENSKKLMKSNYESPMLDDEDEDDEDECDEDMLIADDNDSYHVNGDEKINVLLKLESSTLDVSKISFF